MDRLKTDDEYGYVVDLKYDRELPAGHTINIKNISTEIDALKKMFDRYMDTSTIEKACDIASHKIDFSVSFLDPMIIIMNSKMIETMKYLDDVEVQLQDISHRIIKPSLSGKVMSKEEKLKIYDMQEELLLRRRNLKDALSMQKVFIDNMEKTRNFNLSMNQRKYRPKSERFQPDPDFYIGKAADKYKEETRVDTSVSS